MRTLREMLDGTGLPRYRIARRAGISPSTLILWERDGIPPKRIDVYTRLAQVLGVDPRELLELANGGDTREGATARTALAARAAPAPTRTTRGRARA
jgi:transcriptional regulator with XRE-family HTH domain